MPNVNYIRLKEEASYGQRRIGAIALTVGKVLLWMDLLLVMFVYVGLRGGSDFWLWWVAIEGGLGLALLGVGSYLRSYGSTLDPPDSRS